MALKPTLPTSLSISPFFLIRLLSWRRSFSLGRLELFRENSRAQSCTSRKSSIKLNTRNVCGACVSADHFEVFGVSDSFFGS